jgi:hypothetical protein
MEEGMNKKKVFTFLFEWVKRCEICKIPWNGRPYGEGSNLTVHRIQRASQGGKYVPRNCEVVCAYNHGNDCHKVLHSGEGRRA